MRRRSSRGREDGALGILESLEPELRQKIQNGISGTRTPRSEEEWRAYEQRRADWANQNTGDLNRRDGYDCPLCRNRGYFRRVREDGSSYVEECSCMAVRRNRDRIRRSGLSDLVKRYTFESWEAPEPWQAEAKAVAEDYAAGGRGWMLCSGGVGTGKSHLCTAVCVRLMEEGRDVRYVLWREFAPRAKALVNDAGEYEALLRPLKTVDVLYIDDLYKTGKGQQPTTGDVNLAFEILNARYNESRKRTILSTERSMEEILEIDEAVGSRIYERSREHCLSFRGRGNWRLRG